ncbi:porin [Geobacter sp.]|uniref:porin n=1 Tax=Geobacter sp. TaxID=46610 RepID=UPI0027BA1057|nr:porin [Geobacter sp.]
MDGRTIAAALLFTGAMAAQGVEAKTLEDVLKEKGVITEEDYKEVTKSKPVNFKVGNGISLTSPDEKFQLNIGGQIQTRYSYLDKDNDNDSSSGSAQNTSRFEIKRAKLLLGGYAFTKDVTYKLDMNFINISSGTTKNGGLLESVWLNYRLMDEVQFRFGQNKVQFGRQWITSTANNQFVDSSPVTTAFAPGYDTGIEIHGKVAKGLFAYSLGGYGGVGQNTFRSTSDNAFNVRLALNPLGEMAYSEADLENSEKPLLSIGANYYFNTLSGTTGSGTSGLESNNVNFAKTISSSDPLSAPGWFGMGNSSGVITTAAQRINNVKESVDFHTAGFDAAFKWHGLSLQGEYMFGQADGSKSNNTVRAHGYYAQAGYFVIPKHLELAARYSYIDPNRDVSNDLWVETTGAVSWYFIGHNLKVQADFSNIHRQGRISSNDPPATASTVDDKLVRLQAQLFF